MEKKAWYTSRLVWLNAITVLVGALGYVAGHDIVKEYPSLVAGAVAIQGALNVCLRFVTVKPIK